MGFGYLRKLLENRRITLIKITSYSHSSFDRSM
uniref:Uncharacterized protein n=1 Tax=Arundo donax TaxID=35708 RepID=A0A0A9CAX7_ARUDO